MSRTQAVVAGAVVLIAGLAAYRYFNPPSEAGIRLIDRKADSHELKKVAQAGPAIDKTVGGNDEDFAAALLNFGTEDGRRRAVRQAAKDRALNLVPIKRQPYVEGYHEAPTTMFSAHEPILVTVSRTDQLCTGSRPDECSYADGLYRAGLPPEHEHKKTILQIPDYGGNESSPPGGYHSLIARICSPNDASWLKPPSRPACGSWIETGFDFVVCGVGDVQLWNNGFGQIGRLVHTEDFFRARGGYTFEASVGNQISQLACKANPSAAFVPLTPSSK